ncbi:hypothetical protein XM38_039120 [Halomicronema hongdechloris C2206]|uniref:Uncharacterized protein n=1 Tax=Halomicronema hongdechloris C2206 TaxID=1641165 RepID=A0A1Z3HRS4_9CYAN|nr:Asr1405/Asl0597 family protein [Halomicronema hongdechloris]ASC72952.1 hypothetical protein XM38_039120 [Halomicronema hongdechloris C2206]
MEFSIPDTQLNSVLQIDRVERWNIYSRLQQLDVSCSCSNGQPLRVEVTTASSAVQLWSVVQQFTAPRHTLIERLERCRQKPMKSPASSPRKRGTSSR